MKASARTSARRLGRAGLVTGVALAMGLSAKASFAQSTAAVGNSSVQLYGLIGSYVDRLKRADSTGSVTQLGSGGLTTSFWGIKGREDLGGGLSTIFALESFFQADTGAAGRSTTDSYFGRNAFVGLSSNTMGAVTLGRQTNPMYAAMSLLSPFGNSVVFSPLVVQTFVSTYGGTIVGDTVSSNAIQYQTPLIHGFSGTLTHSFGELANHSSIADNGIHGRYVAGPLSVAASFQRTNIAEVAPQVSQKVYMVGGAYDFKVVKLFGSTVHTDTEGTNIQARTYDAGVSVPFGLGSLWAEYAQTKRDNPVIADTTRKTANLGYDYRFSKRTDVYAVFSRDNLTAYSGGNTYGVGIRHSF